MRGGQPKGASDQWMRNALASGSIVAPPDDPDGRSRAASRAWLVVFVAGLIALIVAATLLWRD